MAEFIQSQLIRSVIVNEIPAHRVSLVHTNIVAPNGSTVNQPHAVFQLLFEQVSWNLEDVQEVIIALDYIGYILQFVRADGRVEPNCLIVDPDTFIRFMAIWRMVKGC